ncbi:MAG: purine-nucleoside phosphorylase [Deltaproteobacteria bacterium]|nr:purine-nucleoside phosphorylase [Deltaproteobacteria bacterium]
MRSVDTVRDAVVRVFGSEAPRWGVVLGSGLGGFADRLDHRRAVPYRELGIPEPAVPGHAGELVVGSLGGSRVACLSGRAHLYEGCPADRAVLGVRALVRWGVRGLALTASVGSLRRELEPGSLVLIRDHLSFLGQNPLQGANLAAFGPRFPDLQSAYTPALRAQVGAWAAELGIALPEGVYAAMPGPAFETPAEVRMLATLGADVVGMSLVPEVIAAAHAGVPIVAFGLVANLAAGLATDALEHESLTAAVASSSADLSRLLGRLIAAPTSWSIVPRSGPL